MLKIVALRIAAYLPRVAMLMASSLWPHPRGFPPGTQFGIVEGIEIALATAEIFCILIWAALTTVTIKKEGLM